LFDPSSNTIDQVDNLIAPVEQNENVIQYCLFPGFPKVLYEMKLQLSVGCSPHKQIELLGIEADGSALGVDPGTLVAAVLKVSTPVEDTL
jgi:hypothetical protein